MKSILNGVALGMAHWAEVHNPAMVEGDQCSEQKVHVATGHTLVEMHVTDWAEAQREDPVLSAVLNWLKAQKQTDYKVLLAECTSSEEGKTDPTELTEFCDSSGSLVPMLNTQRQDQRSAPCGPLGTLCCHMEWVPLRCRP